MVDYFFGFHFQPKINFVKTTTRIMLDASFINTGLMTASFAL